MRLYKYKPLSPASIRLISLQPQSAASLPAISIIHHSLTNETTTYEAVSYVWGATSDLHALYCGDGAYLLITPNLYSALVNFRHESQPRLLWVDAICICQA